MESNTKKGLGDALFLLARNLKDGPTIDGIAAGIMLANNRDGPMQVLELVKCMRSLSTDLGLKKEGQMILYKDRLERVYASNMPHIFRSESISDSDNEDAYTVNPTHQSLILNFLVWLWSSDSGQKADSQVVTENVQKGVKGQHNGVIWLSD